jgi:putative hemolysin
LPQQSRLNALSLVQKFKPQIGGHPPRQKNFASVGKIGWLPGAGLPAAGFRRPVSATLPATLGRLGDLELRLATTPRDVKRCQRLRYRVFYEEMSAIPNAANSLARRDMDEFDAICDHLLVLDHKPTPQAFGRTGPRVVGTYRLLRQDVADINWGFYSAGEFDISGLMEARPEASFLELGRSCVLKPYRDKRTVELLWQGVWAYVLAHGIDVMLGCASLEGTDPDRLALALSYLHHFHRAPDDWRGAALAGRAVDMNRMPKEAIDPKAALRALPPLIKGYLRLGAMIGEGAVVDRQFGTTDVLIVMPVTSINPRYVDYYGGDAGCRRDSRTAA